MWFNGSTTKVQRNFLTNAFCYLRMYITCTNCHQDTKSARLIAVCKCTFRRSGYTRPWQSDTCHRGKITPLRMWYKNQSDTFQWPCNWLNPTHCEHQLCQNQRQNQPLLHVITDLARQSDMKSNPVSCNWGLKLLSIITLTNAPNLKPFSLSPAPFSLLSKALKNLRRSFTLSSIFALDAGVCICLETTVHCALVGTGILKGPWFTLGS